MSRPDKPTPRRPVVPARLGWTEAVLVCGKCLKRMEGGRDLRRGLERELASRTGARRAKVVRTACLKLCPRGGAAVATGSGLAAGRCVVAREGASAGAVLDALGMPAGADVAEAERGV